MIMDVIIDKLRKIEADEDITILYAAEAGSRAVGYCSESSDYDIRFIYKHNDITHYMTINKQRDVIESNDGLYDIVGWDIRKTLQLHYKSNPNLREWINSSIKYIPMDGDIFNNLPDFDMQVLKRHYYSITKGLFRKYVNRNDEVSNDFYKKMLYTVKCILAWMLLDEDRLPPVRLDDLIYENKLDEGFSYKIDKLKKALISGNVDLISDNEVFFLIEWISFYIDYMPEYLDEIRYDRDIDLYNRRFQEIIMDNY